MPDDPKPLRLIFLDIDGVLNDHASHPRTKFCTIDKAMAARLDRILVEADAGFVVSSAWRYLIHGGSMKFEGLRNLLNSHWIDGSRLVGITRVDDGPTQIEGHPACDRGRQICEWLEDPKNTYGEKIDSYVVIDDLDLGISDCGLAFIQTDGKVGLTDEDVRCAIATLTTQPAKKKAKR